MTKYLLCVKKSCNSLELHKEIPSCIKSYFETPKINNLGGNCNNYAWIKEKGIVILKWQNYLIKEVGLCTVAPTLGENRWGDDESFCLARQNDVGGPISTMMKRLTLCLLQQVSVKRRPNLRTGHVNHEVISIHFFFLIRWLIPLLSSPQVYFPFS